MAKNAVSLSRKIIKQGVVVLPVAEYQKLIKQAIPTYYLTGKAAKQLDQRVVQALREYRAGKTIKANSLGEALERYERRKKR